MSESLPVQDVAEDAFRGLRNFSYHTTQLRRSPETVGFHSVLSLVMQQDRALSQCYARIMEANPNFRPSRALSFHLVWELAEQYSHLLREAHEFLAEKDPEYCAAVDDLNEAMRRLYQRQGE